MSKYTPRSQKYWRLTAIVKREEPFCALCGKEIDAWRKDKSDPLRFECDHKISPKIRPDLAEERSNLQATHKQCNRDKERTKTPSLFRSGVYVSVEDF